MATPKYAANVFGDDVVRIGHAETRRLLLRDNDPTRPAPEVTFEDRYTLLWDGGVAAGHISPMRFVELIATAPARMFGLHPRFAPLLPMWKAGTLAAVHAVGLPQPNRSHFAAMEEIEDAAPKGVAAGERYHEAGMRTVNG